MDISEVIRRWQAGNSWRHIASGTGLSKDTVGKYISAAEAAGDSSRRFWSWRGAAQPPSRHQPLRSAAGGGAQRGIAGPVVGSNLSVADQRPVASDPHPGVAGGAELPNLLFVPVPVAESAPLATSQRQHGADGGERPWRGGGTGLRPPGLHPGPGDRPPLRGVGPAGGAGLLSAQLRVAHLQPEAGRGNRWAGGGLGFLRRHTRAPMRYTPA